MKKTNKILSFVLALVMVSSISIIVPLTVNAAQTNANVIATHDSSVSTSDYQYKVLDNNTVEITNYIGAGGIVEIPSELGGYEVSWIGPHAFAGHADITDVIIPSTVRVIDENAFNSCTKLSGVIILPSTTPQTIGDKAFFNCPHLSKIILPDSVKFIGLQSFGYYQNSIGTIKRIDGFEIMGSDGTAAQQYCVENYFSYLIID